MQVKAKCRREKGKVEKETRISRIGETHAVTIGDLMDAVTAIIAQNIFHGNNQDVVLSAAQPDTIPHNAQDRRSPKAKNAEYEGESTWHAEAEWQESTRQTEEYEASKGKKGKGKSSKSKGNQREEHSQINHS